jgi:polysaccharide pyruvyl transferase WcaK-like protein
MGNKMDKRFLWGAVGQSVWALNKLAFSLQNDNGKLIRFDTALGTDNLGDYIIMHYCNKILDELFPDYQSIHISTHLMPAKEQEEAVKKTKYKFVCGTNLLTSNIEHHWRWILPDGVRQKMKFSNVILLGVGWGEYQEACTDYSRMIYRAMLNPNLLHSVRDQYTMEKLQQAGFNNIINTGCPTTWALTPEFCRDIPTKKSKDVVTTITDYRRDIEKDNEMLSILSRNYDHIYLWIQGKYDEEYLKTLNIPENLSTIPANLDAYEEILARGGVDYVGTRLHAGIYALNHKIRSIILAVDNRATEMGRDVNLPVIQRNEMEKTLEQKIQSEFITDIKIKQDNIESFKAQFRR